MLRYLLINMVIYKENCINKKFKINVGKEIPQREMDLEEMITYTVRAGYEVRKDTSGAG